MPITKRDLENVKNAMDEDAKAMFLDMTREEQLTVLLSMAASNSNRLALVERRQIDFETDYKAYRRERERKEVIDNDDDEKMGTTQKIVKMIEEERAKQFNYVVWFRDRVMPTIITAITLALLALAFGAKLP